MRLIAHAVLSSLVFFVVACLPSPCEVFAQNGEPQYLFKPVPHSKGATLPADQKKQIDRIKKLPTTVDVQVAEVDLNLFGSKSLTLNMGDDKLLGAVTDRIEKRSATDFTWFGKIPRLAQRGDAVLVVKDGSVTGFVRAGDQLYEVVPLGGKRHAIIHVDQTKFPPDEGFDPEKIERFQKEMEERSRGGSSSRFMERDEQPEAGKTYTVRAIIAYTPLAVNVSGSKDALEGKIRAAVQDSNQSYVNSSIHAKLEIAHLYQTNYVETGKSEEDLQRFVTKGDGYMDEVHKLRIQHRADVGVVIVGKSRDLCGLAAAIGAKPDDAFCLVVCNCLARLTLPHEIGHLMGARHNWEIDPMWDKQKESNRGFWYKGITPQESWATVMSYGCPQGGCARVPYWSNPDVAVAGVPTGSDDCCNNVATVNKRVVEMSKFRDMLR
jgi:hypothetical protein